MATSNMVPRFSFFSKKQSPLKRRVMMLTKKRDIRLPVIKSSVYGAICGLGMTLFSVALLANNSLAQSPERTEVLPITTIQPQYPQEALDKGFEGWVVAELTIDKEGSVYNAKVIDHCVTKEGDECLGTYDGIFDASALSAISNFEFEPIKVNGVATETHGVTHMFRFELDEK